MAKLNFQQPLLQSSMSHDPPHIILICWFDAQVINKKSKEQLLFEIQIFCNDVKVLVTFAQFDASSLNKSINFFKKKEKNWTKWRLFWKIMYLLISLILMFWLLCSHHKRNAPFIQNIIMVWFMNSFVAFKMTLVVVFSFLIYFIIQHSTEFEYQSESLDS